MENGIWVRPRSSYMKSGINSRKSSTTTSHQGKTVMVCPYLMSSEKIRQFLMTVKIGMYRSFIKQVLSGTCLPETHGKFSVLSRNWPLELTFKCELKASSVAERQCRNFKLDMMANNKKHVGIKFLERNQRIYSTRRRLLSHLISMSQNLRVFSICWMNMVFYSTRSRWPST